MTALPPPSLADVGQPDHDNASAAGLQLEAPLNEHESRCTTAARVMQPKVTTKAEGAAAEGGGGSGDGRGVGPPAFAAGAVGIITAQPEVKVQKLQWALFASFATYMALRTGLPAPPLIVFSSSTRPSATFLDSRPDAEFPHQTSAAQWQSSVRPRPAVDSGRA